MKKLKSHNVCFLGRTGNGKTSLINALFGTTFPTDAHVSSTKEMYTATLMANNGDVVEAYTAIDTPGIGEFSNNDKYYRYYEHAASIADCVVLVMTFDRTDAPAQRLILSLKDILSQQKRKYVIAINHIDSRVVTDTNNTYNPWNLENDVPSEQCLKNIEERTEILKQKFVGKFPEDFEIIPVCALRKYGIENLKQVITTK